MTENRVHGFSIIIQFIIIYIYRSECRRPRGSVPASRGLLEASRGRPLRCGREFGVELSVADPAAVDSLALARGFLQQVPSDICR